MLIYRVNVKSNPFVTFVGNPSVTFVDISAMRADFSQNFTQLLNQKIYTLSPIFVEINYDKIMLF